MWWDWMERGNSVERLLEYTKLPQEPPRVADGGGEPPVGWPSCGRLVFDDVYATYRPALPPVLKGLSFEVAPGQMCGIAGRTGSGK
jgi:ATP-binding cassette subfamily C (CFTR/MRP) protein 4